MTDPTLPSLADLRGEIDRIDAAMHGLLMERGQIIERLIEVKKTAETGSAFRPAREVDVVRRLVENHKGRLPVELVVQIWRQIISTFTYVQSPHSVHVVMGPEQENARELARFHFGFGVPLVKHSSPGSVIAAIARDRGDLGLIGLGPARDAWWEKLGGPDQPIAMATAPAIARAASPRPPQALGRRWRSTLSSPAPRRAAATISSPGARARPPRRRSPRTPPRVWLLKPPARSATPQSR